MRRLQLIEKAQSTTLYDVIVIGGGATGAGIALDAALRGYKTLLLEQFDFSKGTSSKATKLIHGGVRYLQQGQVSLVKEALRERTALLKNAPHLCAKLEFVLPTKNIFQQFYYFIGLKVYDLLSGSHSLGKTKWLSKQKVLEQMPNISSDRLFGGIAFLDGQFDDARLNIELVKHALKNKAAVLNYMRVTSLIKTKGKITGVKTLDTLTDKKYTFNSKSVINATGVFSSNLLHKNKVQSSFKILASKGSHIVVDKQVLNSERAVLIPKTSDGRVIFALPWQDKTIIGTTDKPVKEKKLEPFVWSNEVNYMIKHFNAFNKIKIHKSDVKAVFSGLRPLVRPNRKIASKRISRSHKIETNMKGLVSIMGGKWTTYRNMAEQTLDVNAKFNKLKSLKCLTQNYAFCATENSGSKYGDDITYFKQIIKKDTRLAKRFHPKVALCPADIKLAIDREFALTLEDVLARRSRILFLDAALALKIAPQVVKVMAGFLSKDADWQQNELNRFKGLAKKYMI